MMTSKAVEQLVPVEMLKVMAHPINCLQVQRNGPSHHSSPVTTRTAGALGGSGGGAGASCFPVDLDTPSTLSRNLRMSPMHAWDKVLPLASL
jgi:hypothetical protein